MCVSSTLGRSDVGYVGSSGCSFLGYCQAGRSACDFLGAVLSFLRKEDTSLS